MKITDKILKQAGEMSRQHLMDYGNRIDEAFQNNDEVLDINLKIRLSLNKGKFKIQNEISFVTDRTKDKSTIWYDPNQHQLFESDPDEPEGE